METPITISRGSDLVVGLTIYGPDGTTPLDLTDYTFVGEVRQDGVKVVDLGFTVVSAIAGTVNMTLTDTVTEALPVPNAAQPLTYRVKLTDDTGYVLPTILHGPVVMTE